ncbi:class I SAM-dependent DNA methyltransferase [Roseivivax halotolerans]|uniref:class I SAM-dependent DNA methyltransferase n=1 Tax=Roseivivax halotolerans TaxID=93684 RepID=UPI001FE81A76|nr:class I SAM-dependent methyltransferase [Roseivivax halotolerans]
MAAEKLSRHLEDGSAVFDVGCGTGLFGQALARHGAFRIVGLDISAESLSHAHTRGVYDQLIKHDLQKLPLPLGENSMNAAASIGVLTYIESVVCPHRVVQLVC